MAREAIEAALASLRDGEDFAWVSMVESHGSTPRHAGAQMLVRADGSIQGTIGGGVMEAEAIRTALKVLSTRQSSLMEFDLSDSDAADLGMICGGRGALQVEYVAAASPGAGDFFRELLGRPKETLFIFGAGHCGQKLAQVAELVDFATVVVDDRADYAHRERFPDAERIVVPDSFDHALDGLPIDEDSYIVIMTRGHVHDKTVLAQALSTSAGYVGMIGSRKKVAETFRALREEGFSPESISRVHAPIGLDIGSETPEEIAISIVAQLIKVRTEKLRAADQEPGAADQE
jgi:xanthine dehydrogenase accessory factor